MIFTKESYFVSIGAAAVQFWSMIQTYTREIWVVTIYSVKREKNVTLQVHILL